LSPQLQGDAEEPYTGLPLDGAEIPGPFNKHSRRAKLSDTESGFRAYSREAILKLELKETRMAVSAEIVTMATLKGLKIKEAPISVNYDTEGSTLHPVKHGLGVMRRIIVMISERRPLLFFGVTGGICGLAGLSVGIMAVRSLHATQVMQTGSVLLSMLLITVGVLIMSTGLILDVLARRLSGK